MDTALYYICSGLRLAESWVAPPRVYRHSFSDEILATENNAPCDDGSVRAYVRFVDIYPKNT